MNRYRETRALYKLGFIAVLIVGMGIWKWWGVTPF